MRNFGCGLKEHSFVSSVESVFSLCLSDLENLYVRTVMMVRISLPEFLMTVIGLTEKLTSCAHEIKPRAQFWMAPYIVLIARVRAQLWVRAQRVLEKCKKN